jgi:glucose-6-phosphate dehydrogenase assembly protein OpcA
MRNLIVLLLLAFLAFGSVRVSAQCAMCQRVAETSMQDKQKEKAARSLNNGILYLMTLPYLIGGIGAVVWWKNKRKPQS